MNLNKNIHPVNGDVAVLAGVTPGNPVPSERTTYTMSGH